MTADEALAHAQLMGRMQGVRRATPVTYLSALLDDPAEPSRPLPVTLKAVQTPPTYTGFDRWPDRHPMPAVLGVGLADSVGAAEGDVITVRLPPDAGSWIVPSLRLTVVGTFSLAFAEFDQQWLIVPLDRVQQVLPEVGVAGIEVVLDDPMAVDRIRGPLEEAFPTLLFTDWREMNRSLFAALRWQTISLFVVLSLVVGVASFQVSSALVVLAIDKRRSAGTLHALGATPTLIRRVLLTSGILLGGAGLGCGLVIGTGASWVLTALRVVRFPEGLARVYMVDTIPFHVSAVDLMAVAAVGIVLVAAASFWPAWRSSREDPISALRAA
jgi:lipoprotein-releasing system permease protein